MGLHARAAYEPGMASPHTAGFLHGVVSSTWSFMTFIPCFFLLIKTSSAEGRRGGREEGAGGKRAKGEGILVEVQECGENIKE